MGFKAFFDNEIVRHVPTFVVETSLTTSDTGTFREINSDNFP